MRARDSRLADRLMFVVSVTTNLSQRIAGRLVQLPAPVTFILSQLATTGLWSGALTRLAGGRYILPSYMNRKPHVAVVGATGAVGLEMIKTLEKRNFPVGKLTLLASARSLGKTLKYRGQEIAVTELKKDSFGGIDIALFSAGGSISKEFAPIAAQAGCVVIARK